MIATIKYELDISYHSSGNAKPTCRLEVPAMVGKMLQKKLSSAGENGISIFDLFEMAETNKALMKFGLKVLERGYEMQIMDWCQTGLYIDCCPIEDYFDEDYKKRRFRIPRYERYDDKTPTYERYRDEYLQWVFLPRHTQEFISERVGLYMEGCFENPVLFDIMSIETDGIKDEYKKPRHLWNIEQVYATNHA